MITIYDIETYPNYCMVGFMDHATGEVTQFNHDEGDAIKKYIKGRTLVGFNSLNYDDIMLTAMMRGKSLEKLYNLSFDLVEGEGRRWDYANDVERSIDIMEVLAGQASLKLYGSRLNTKKLQDLPYPPHNNLSKKQKKEVAKYNINDLILTREAYDFLKPQLDIRRTIGETYGLDVMSRSDAQIAEDVFKKELGIFRKPRIPVPTHVTYTAPKYVKFKSKQLKNLKKKFESCDYDINRKTGKFISQDWLDEKVVIDGVDYTIGYGGLHSNEKSLAVKDGLKNADIASMYPSLIINSGKFPTQLGEEWLDLYTQFRDDRMKIKHTNKELSAVLKIFLNGTYGKLNSHYSILYAPHLMLDTTITGQLSLLMVIEALTDAGIEVVSANTDGVEYKDDGTGKGEKIIDKLGRKMNLVWEHASYKSLYARDVNSYIAVYDGYVKRKGFYSGPKIDKNNEHIIVQDAIAKFLLDGTPMRKTIKKCKDIAKFCVSRKVTGGAVWSAEEYPNTEEFDKFIVEFEAGERKDNKALRLRNFKYKKEFVLNDANENYVGKTVRYYFSKEGKPMFSKERGSLIGKTDEHHGVRPMMQLKKKMPKDLDYGAYYLLADRYLAELGWTK